MPEHSFFQQYQLVYSEILSPLTKLALLNIVERDQRKFFLKKFSHNLNLAFKVYHYSISLRKKKLARFTKMSVWSESTVILDENWAFVHLFYGGRVIKPDSSGYTPTTVWSLRELLLLRRLFHRTRGFLIFHWSVWECLRWQSGYWIEWTNLLWQYPY